jgi:large subunit ribosomal protein L24
MQRVRVGDLVQVITGREKGKTGRVSSIVSNDSRVVVEGLNKVVRHTRPSQANVEGGRLEKEAPIHISNVMPIDADSGKPTRVRASFTPEDGTDGDGKQIKNRVSVSGAQLKQGDSPAA